VSAPERRVFLDTETTGLQPGIDKIVEVACVEVVGREIREAVQSYVRPPIRVTPGALAVHGLSDDMLAGHPTLLEVWPRFAEFIGDSEVMIHNASFDMAFLRDEVPGLAFSKVTDTIAVARGILGPKRKLTLDQLSKNYGIKRMRGKYHGALQDATDLANVWLQMTIGQEVLALPAAEERKPVAWVGGRPYVYAATAAELAAHKAFMERHGMMAF
jgi:DNA polymerase-3 subunit epsilon